MVRPLDPRLLRHARASRGYVVLIAVLGLATAVTVVAQALLLAQVIAAVAMDGARPHAVAGRLAAVAGLIAVRAALAWVQERFGHRAATTVIAELRQAVLQQVSRSDPATDPASLTTLVTRGLDALDGYLTKYLPQLLLVCTVTPLVLAVIWWHDTIAGVTVAVTLPLVPLFMALVGWSTAAAAQRRLATLQRLGGQVLDLVAGLPTLRALGRQRGQAVRVRQAGDAYRRATMVTLRQAFLSALVLETLTTLSVALVAVGVGLRLVYGHLDLRTGLAVLILAPEVYLPLRMVGVHYHASVDGLAAAGAAFEILDGDSATERPGDGATQRPGDGATERPGDGATPTGLPAPDLRDAEIGLRAVSVHRRGRDAPHELDLTLAPGEVVALVGPNGAGKSTALELILALRRPDAGQVQVRAASPGSDTGDGPPAQVTALERIDPRQWHRQIAWVPQHPAIVPGTIAENVWLGESTQDPERLRIASAATGLDAVVAATPDGWQTPVGGDGHGLSAGQRQRLGLTRALLRTDAALVLLDEPTAHLDAEAEQAVPAAIADWRRRGVTVLLVTHRPALAALADRQVLVEATQ